ncbi:hypothetical protein jhhlp_007922 [Lomentospora prolificans]|uniref:alpha-glucosidase n=1 Tax=Lomentospora prolificans TaxID=41688 RepID=A0A2N3N0Y2_9PEZI|nr:hypothetical protein jhhlp_007922 [Lomentospora prolificans]
MARYERIPHCYILEDESTSGETLSRSQASITLRSTDTSIPHPFVFGFEAVRDNVFHLSFTSESHPSPPHPSIERFDAKLSTEPEIRLSSDKKTKKILTRLAEATIDWSGAPIVSISIDDADEPIYQDLPFRSYAADGTGVAHYTRYKRDTLHVGLGEKAAPMNLAGRSFTIATSDTFGYDAYRTDPLYKHIPLLINVTRQGCVGIFSTSHARGTWNVGSEIDGLWGPFKVYRQAHGGLEEYIIVGKTVEEVVRSFAEIAGFPLLVPRYMMGYIGGGMKYSMQDTPAAADAILDFLGNCEKNDIPISAFQMSSGYTVAETEPKTRNVFTWNRHRFPDPRAFTRECHRKGVRLLANIKPYVLANHPEYGRLLESGSLFYDPATKASAVARLWSAGGGESGEGGHIDFTSQGGFDWWYHGCRELKKCGIDGMWNDNNEYSIPSDDWICALQTVSPFGEGMKDRHVGLWGRALQTELMGKSSYNACVDHAPNERPMVLTRSATAGTMRYACSSWSGDNVTSWEGMKGGNALSLNAGFSLLQCYGHDIGGFEGPQPSPELLVRWVQLGIHSPRFAINCYKTSANDNLVGEVIEPWMYPSVTPIIRQAIKRRYELIPYTYSLSILSHFTAIPSQRWTGWGHEDDPEVWTKAILNGDTQYWFGEAFLVAGVYEPGATSARLYLPRNTSRDGQDLGFLNTNAPFQHLPSGKWHDVTAVWYDSIAILAKCGTAVPVGKNRPTTCRVGIPEEEEEFPNIEKDDWRGLEIYPPPPLPGTGANLPFRSPITFENCWREDDGISAESQADICTIKVTYTVDMTPGDIIIAPVEVEKTRSWAPLWLHNGLDIILPVGDRRTVRSGDETVHAVYKGIDARGRAVWNIPSVAES